MIIEYLLVAILSALIIYMMCNRKKKYENFESSDDGEFGPQFVYSAGRIKSEGGLAESEIDDYNSAEAIRKRRLKQMEEEARLYEEEVARIQALQAERPNVQIPLPPPPPRPPASFPSSFPAGGGIRPPLFFPSSFPAEPTPPPYGQIKEEEPTGQNLLAQIGKVVKKKRKLG